MRKPRLSRKTIEQLFYEGKALTGKYGYEVTTYWNDKLKAYGEVLSRWDKNNNVEEWELGSEGVYEFERKD